MGAVHTLETVREFDLLEHVYRANASLGARVVIPPGDDMAMLRLDSGEVLAAVDQLVEGRHFVLSGTPLELIGRKAITRCLSDVAAMAARPVASLAAVTLPPSFGEERAAALFEAMRQTAETYAAPLVGGDTAIAGSRRDPLACSVTIIARPGGRPPVRRDEARPGDSVYVTGQLGGSIEPDGQGHHLTFEPRIELALALADQLGERLHAMIDLSDGLGRDAGQIARASGVAVELEAHAIPRRDGLDWMSAVADGEDYELCFAASGAVPGELRGVRITRVGRIPTGACEPGSVSVCDGEERHAAESFGWQHES